MFWALSTTHHANNIMPPGGAQSRHERDRPRVSLSAGQTCLLEQERGNDAVADRMICAAMHLAFGSCAIRRFA
jgi:hypothetical protein